MIVEALRKIGINTTRNYVLLRRLSVAIRVGSDKTSCFFTPLQSVEDARQIKVLRDKFPQKIFGSSIELQNNINIYRFSKLNNNTDDYGKAIVISGESEITVRYNKKAISPKAGEEFYSKLQEKDTLGPLQFAIFESKEQIPFTLETRDKNSFFLPLSPISKIQDLGGNTKKYSLNLISKLNDGDAKRINILIQKRIYCDKYREGLHEATRSQLYERTSGSSSSGALINFEENTRENNTRKMEFSYEEKILVIFSTHKLSGALLNYCGFDENPEDRKDCEEKIIFPANSIISLTIPANTFQSFEGDFCYIEIDAKETFSDPKNITSSLLESSKIFSGNTRNNPESSIEPKESSELEKNLKQNKR